MTQEFRTIQPRAHEIESLKLIEPEKFILDNGIQVFAINAGSEDLIKLDFVFKAGSSVQDQPLLASFTNKCLQEGTESYSSKQIADTIDFHGAYLRNAANKDDARISLYCMGKYFSKLLPLVREVVFQPKFPADEVQTIINKSRQEYLVNMGKVKYVARMNFPGLIFGEKHPYATPLSENDFENMDYGLMASFHQQYYAQQPFYMLVSGKIPGDIRQHLNVFFGQHNVNGLKEATKYTEQLVASEGFHLIEKENSLQSALRIGKVLFNKTHPDFIKMQVLNTILGGYFGSRLMTNIREDKGYTYGIGSMLTSLKQAGIFTIASEVGVDVRQKAVDEIFNEVNKLRAETVPEEELKLVKNYLLGGFLRSADGPFALSELVKSVVDYGYDHTYFDGFLETIKNITAKEIRDLAVKYLDPDTMITLVAGK